MTDNINALATALAYMDEYFGGLDGFNKTYRKFEMGLIPSPKPQVDELRPRAGDPASSQAGLDKVARPSMVEAILEAARQLPQPFTDGDLRQQMEFATGFRFDRSLVARSRFYLEKIGCMVREEETDGELRFVLTESGWKRGVE